MLILLYSPHLIPYTHWIIQFSTVHLLSLMSFPICCSMMLQILLLPLSFHNNVLLWLWSCPISAVILSLACLYSVLPSLPSGLSSGCFPPIHTIIPPPSDSSMEPPHSYDYLSDLGRFAFIFWFICIFHWYLSPGFKCLDSKTHRY